jgi:hypothetical protein
LRGHQLLQAGFPARGQQGFASALVSLGLQCAAFLELLPDPPHGGDTETKKLRNIAGAFALSVEVDDAFADRQWYGSHGDTLPHHHAHVKLHVLWNCSKAAKARAKTLHKLYPPLTRREYAQIKRKNFKNEVVGVRKLVKKVKGFEYEFWEASWSPRVGFVKKRLFSVNKYGDKEAELLALKTRQEGLANIED